MAYIWVTITLKVTQVASCKEAMAPWFDIVRGIFAHIHCSLADRAEYITSQWATDVRYLVAFIASLQINDLQDIFR